MTGAPDPVPARDPATPSDAALQGFLGFRVRRAWLAIQADLAGTLSPFDLRMITYTALSLVRGNPGLSQTRLAALMDIERPNLVAIVAELERRGLVRRDRVPEDRRAYALHLTEEGHRLHGAATTAVRANDARLASGLDEADRAIVEAALARLRDNAERR